MSVTAGPSQYTLSRQRLNALLRTDSLPADVRAMVHEVGLPIVEAFLQVGVTEARHMRHIARLFWSAAHGQDNARVGARANLDVMLRQSGGAPHSAALARLMASMQLVIVASHPTPRMVQASIAETGRHGLLSKEQKHHVRLAAAMKEGAAELWPDVFAPAGDVA